MIRLLGRLLRVGLLLSLIGGVGWLLWPLLLTGWALFDVRGERQVEDPRLAAAAVDTVYVMPELGWLEFPIISQGDRLKIITNATLLPESAQQPALFWPYQVELQWVNNAGQVLKAAIYHQRTGISAYQSPDSPPMTAAFYLNQPSLPADGRMILLNLRETPGATRLRLRLNRRDAHIQDVVVRVYTQNFLFDMADAYGWQRLSRRLREHLAQASVYGADWLSLPEQVNLMRQRWSPIAPIGILGQNYRTRKLYGVVDVEAQSPGLPILPAGLYLNRELRGVLPIPEPGGVIDLELIDVAEQVAGADLETKTDPPKPDSSPIRLLWHGRKPMQHLEQTIELSGAETRWAHFFETGLLEVVTERPVVVRASLRQEHHSRVDLVAEPIYQRLYRLEPGRTLDFAVAHTGGQPTFWRVDTRLERPDTVAATTIHYELLDAQATVRHQGELPVADTPSVYDWLVSRTAFFDRISEPASYAFMLPESIVLVRLQAMAPVLIAGYTRPPDLPRRVRVPEDYLPGLPRDRGQPFWFPVLPVEAAQLLQQGQTALMVLQSRPPQLDPDILAGRYDWRDYDPEDHWRGRYLLSPREPGQALRPQARGSVFRPLPVGTPVRFDIQGLPGRRMVEATLLVLRDNDTPCPVRIIMDGETVHTDTLLTHRSEIRLPPRPTGMHTFNVQSCPQSGRWLINYAGGGEGSWVRRMAYRLDHQDLEFVYPKTTAGEEILTGIFRTPLNERDRLRLQVTVEIPSLTRLGPATRLTAREWIYDILPDHRQPLPVLGTATEAVGVGQRFFLPLGDDLPVGPYRIRMHLATGRGYVLFYQVIPGEPTVLELFSEEETR